MIECVVVWSLINWTRDQFLPYFSLGIHLYIAYICLKMLEGVSIMNRFMTKYGRMVAAHEPGWTILRGSAMSYSRMTRCRICPPCLTNKYRKITGKNVYLSCSLFNSCGRQSNVLTLKRRASSIDHSLQISGYHQLRV